MLKQQPHMLTPQESAFAAEHFGEVYAFLSENSLTDEGYYDCAVNGFLAAVKEHCAYTGQFKALAASYMSKECSLYESSLQKIPTFVSISEYYNGYYRPEDIIADVKNTMDEAISAIALEETLQSFDSMQKDIVMLLMNGYSKQDVADMLHISFSALIDEIYLIQKRHCQVP